MSISLLSVNVKIISKALSKRLINDLPSLISDNQSAYVDGRFISEGGRLIADILQINDVLKLNGILVTVDIQKDFDSVNHQFLTLALKGCGFGKTFIKRIKTKITTKYFKLDKGTRQGDLISAYLFILVLEMVFNLIKQNKNIHGLTFFDHTFLCAAYADDTTFFLKDKESVEKVMNVFDTFFILLGLKPNKYKCEIDGIDVLNGPLWNGMYRFNKKFSKLSIHFSYNKKTGNEENFIKLIKSIENVLKICRRRNLKVQPKIKIFKTLAISKVIHFPHIIIAQLNKIR